MIKQFVLLAILFSSGALSLSNFSDSSFVSVSLKDYSGKSFQIENMLGEKVTAIVFWTTWSRDSGIMLNMMQEFYEKYQKKGFQVIGICVEQEKINDSSVVIIKNILDKQHITFINLYDDGLKMFRAQNIIAVPTTIILDSSKKIITRISGYSVSTKAEIANIIDEKIEYHIRKNVQTKEHVPLKEALRYYNMAVIDYKRGKYEKSKDYAIKAISLDSLFEKPVSLLAELSIEEERWNEANDLVEKGLKIDSTSLSILALKSILLFKDGKNNEAKNLLKIIIQKDSVNTISLVYYAYILGLEGKIDESMQVFFKAEVINPKEIRIFKYRIKINKLIGNNEFVKKDSLKIRSLVIH